MQKLNYGRHLPAFLLLFLVKAPACGSMLKNMMEESVPFNNADSPAIYRALNELEKSGEVVSYWDTSSSGPAKKCYNITSKGLEQLKEFKNHIEQRKKNLDFFLSECDNLKLDERAIV